MPSDTGGGESREQRGEAGRLDDWRRIEAEKPDRDRARKEWDAEHDPSEEFERAARPLSEDYGRDRPRHRELTPQQRADIEAFTGRPADEVMALRDKDPRAAHNRDEHGRIRHTRDTAEPAADTRDQPSPGRVEAAERTSQAPIESARRTGEPVDASPTTTGANERSAGDRGDSSDAQPEHRDHAERPERGERGGTYVRVGFDQHGYLDWSTARYENGEPYDPADFPAPTNDTDPDPDHGASAPEDRPAAAPGDTGSERRGLDARLSDHPDARTARDVLNGFAGSEGLTAEQRVADDEHIATRAKDRPWLQIAADQEPEVRHVYCERDRADGHDPARHDGWRDAAGQEQRTAASKDPAYPTDSPAYRNSVDWFKNPPPDDVGGKKKQHAAGEHSSWIADPVTWAVATARAVEHPDVQQALASDSPPRNVRVPLEDVLGSNGHVECDGYTLVTDGFTSSREAMDNRDAWIARIRELMRDQGADRDQAEVIVEQESAKGDIRWVKPEVRRIETFEGGTCQISFKRAEERSGTAISTICYNPPTANKEGTR